MKLDKLKTLFKAKRILALALAAAMTVTSLPQTAYAAEAQAPETETAVEVQEEDEQPAENKEEADDSAAENKESVPLEAGTEENVSSTTETAETEATETTEAAGTSEVQETNETEAANQAEGDNTPAEITYKLENKLEDDAALKTASYDGNSHFGGSSPAYTILEKIEVQRNGSFVGTLEELFGGFTFKWQKEGADSTAEDTDPALLPVNAGKYQLVITPKADGTYANAAALTITGFTIEQAEVEIDFDFKGGSVAPGTAKEKVTDYIENVYVYSSADNFWYDPEDENTKLKIEVKVIDPFTNNETGDASLKKTGDYLAQVTVSFSDKATDEEKANYNLPQSLTKKIEVADLKATTITFDVADAKDAVRSDNGKKVKVITQAYGNEVKVPSYTNVKVEEEEAFFDKDGNEQHNAVTPKDGDVTGKWHSAEFRSWTETEKVAEKNEDGTDKTDDNGDIIYKNEMKTLCSLTVGDELSEGATPADAGTYVYRVTYAGDKDQYAKSYADIVVEVTPIEVEVKPAGDNKYYVGGTVKDVLSKISYESINAENIWGTSYDADNNTQSYEPLFGVYKVKNGEAELLDEDAKFTEEKDVTYEVRFTGKKIVRSENGSVCGTKNINDAQVDSFNSNYLTKTDADTLAANKLVLELSDVKVTIDTTDITSDAALQAAGLKKSDITIDGNTIYTKVYSDNGALYNTRAEYKKAEAGSGELTYKWYKWTPNNNYAARYDIKKAHVAVFNKELNFKSSWTSLAVNNNDFVSVKNSLSNAGIYKLQITYDDGSAYAQENIYYAIEQQQLRVVPTNVPAANYGMDTDDYIKANDSQFQPKLQMLPNNDKSSSWAEMEGWTQGRNGDYWFSTEYYWGVEAKAPEPKEGESADWVGWSYVFSFDQRVGEADQTVEQNKYRLIYDGITINDNKHNDFNYTFEEYSIEDVKADNGEATAEVTEKRIVSEPLSTADITVNKVGEKTLTLKLPEKSLDVTETYDNTLKKDKIDLSGVKYVDSDNKEVTPQFIWEYIDDGGNTFIVSPDEAINGGEYDIYAKYDGDDSYAPMSSEQVATLTIEKAELTVSVKPFTEDVAAGNTSSNVFYAYNNHLEKGDLLTVEGFPTNEAEDVKNAFTQWTQIEGTRRYSYPAWTIIGDDEIEYWQPSLAIYGSDQEKLDSSERLKSGEKYTLNVDEDRSFYLASPYCNNYTMKIGKPVEITAAYVKSTVSLYSYASDNKLTVADKTTSSDTEKFVHDITFRESVPYTDAVVEGKTVYGHYATIEITAPREFSSEVPETAFYENAMKNVENAGAIEVYANNGVIRATFDLSKDGENGLEPNPVTFSLVWKPGFVEKFTITPTQDNLAADLRKAVAPKSVAFNAPKTKMVVGEVQELDVKITKVQNEDLVYLDYRIASGAPEDVLAVSSQGKITALKEGTTTVEVYPVRIVNNSKEQITSVKPAQAKITVSKVAAPKVGTVVPADVSVEVQYPYVKNNGKYYDYGYRREVYVMQENKKTVADFDSAIAAFEKTGDYKKAGLAAAPIYITNDVEKDIADELSRGIYTKHVYNDELCGLANGKNITIQVKVDGLTPKTPYTVYVRNVSAQRTVTNKDGSQKTVTLSANGVPKDFKTTLGQVKELVVASEGEASTALLDNRGVDYYEYELTSGGAQLAVTGYFSAVEDGVDQAERPDLSDGYLVPFADKTLKTKLLEPKLEYRMYQVMQNDDGSWYYSKHEYYNENIGKWDEDSYTAKYTKVDKKGKLKFTQPETLAIFAYDAVTKTESKPIIVKIKAEADSATGKSVTLKVGQKTPIVDLVAYKAGSVALDSSSPYYMHNATTTGNDYLKVDANGNITPVMFDKAAAKQTVTVTGTPSVTGAATVTIKELDPIKNLKINNLMDNSFVLDFAPSIYAEGYLVDIKNSVGDLIQRKYISQYDKYGYYNDGFIWYYSEKKRAYVLFDEYKDRFVITGLKAKCKYNVTVTAVYGDAESKKVTKSVTTTKMPAYDYPLANNEYGGMDIWVFADGALQDTVNYYPFVSGNRYTFVAEANQGAQYAVTDKLSWSSSDGKVAQVKAVGGTYSATIKALKAGTTTIEVKSGILKQTIARWRITVRSVGDAYNNAYFYDENEDLRGDGTDRYDTAEKIVLNVPTAVELAAGESKTFKFTAEEAGDYTVTELVGMNNADVEYYLYSMEKGETRLVKVRAYDEPVSGTIIVEKVPGNSFADRTPIKLGETLSVSDNGYVVFTAEKDGLYRFAGSSSIVLYEGENRPISGKSGYTVEYAMKANATVYVKSDSYSTNKITVGLINISSLETGKEYSVEGGHKTYWYTFKAPEKGDYRFMSENSSVRFYVYKDLDAVNDNNSSGASCAMDAEKTVYVRVYVDTSADVSFEVVKVEPIVITKDQKVYSGKEGVLKNAETKYLLTPETDAIYTFTLDSSVRSIAIYSAADEETAIKSDTYTDGLSYPLVKGTTYAIKVNNTNSYDLALSVDDTAIDALSVDGESKTFTSSNTSLSNDNAYLTFTVPENGDGTYKFEFNNSGSSAAYVYLMGEPSDNISNCIGSVSVYSSGQATMEHYLTAGKKVWMQLNNSYNIASDVSVTVKKAGGAIQPVSDEAATVKAGETAWFSYNVTENGRYRFGHTASSGSTTLRGYADMDKQDNPVVEERYYKVGSTVYLKVTNNSTEDAADVKVTANKIPTEAWTDASATQPISSGETKWYAFTAGEEGEYQFVSENASGYSSGSIYLYTQKQFEAENGGSYISGSTVIYPFAKDETVYLKVSPYSDITLRAEKVEMQILADGENTVEIVNNNTAWRKFTVPQTGIYTFTPNNNDNNGYLYLYADKESYASNRSSQYASNGNPICYPLIEGTTIYLKIIYSYGNEYKLMVNMDDKMAEVKKGANPLTLTAGEDVWLYYMVTDNDKSDDRLRLSYSSNDISILSLGFVSSFTSYNWKNNMRFSIMTQNSEDSYTVGDGGTRIIKLTSQNSGTITFNLRVGKN